MRILTGRKKETKQEADAKLKKKQISTSLQTQQAPTSEIGATNGMPLFLKYDNKINDLKTSQDSSKNKHTPTDKEEDLDNHEQNSTESEASEDIAPTEGITPHRPPRTGPLSVPDQYNQDEPDSNQAIDFKNVKEAGTPVKNLASASTSFVARSDHKTVTSSKDNSLITAPVPQLNQILTGKKSLAAEEERVSEGIEAKPLLAAGDPNTGKKVTENEMAAEEDEGKNALSKNMILGAANKDIDLVSAQTDSTNALAVLIGTAGNLGSLMSTGVKFSPNEQETQVDVNLAKSGQQQRLATESLATDFLNRNAGQLQVFFALGLTVPEKIRTLAATSKLEIDRSVATNSASVTNVFDSGKNRSRSAAAGARNLIIRQHKETIPLFKAATKAAKVKAEKAHKSAITILSSQEIKQIAKIHTLYADGDRIYRATGTTIGSKAIKKASEWEKLYISQKINRDDNLSDGPLTDDRMEARSKAALLVGEEYKKELVTVANEQADEAQKGKAKDLTTASETASKQRETLYGQLKTALDGLDKAETDATTTADVSKDNMVQSVNSSLSTTLKALTALESTELARLTAYGEQQKLAIDRDANLAIASLVKGTDQAITTLGKLLSDFAASAGDTSAPNQEALMNLLAESQAQFDSVSTMLMQQLEDGIQSSEKGIDSGGSQTVEALSTLGQNAISQSTTTVNEFASGMASTSQSATTSFRQMQTSHTKSADGAATAADQGFQQITTSIEAHFSTGNKALEENFKNSAKALEEGLEQQGLSKMDDTVKEEADKAAAQVQPRWKSVLKVLLVIAVVLVVALVAGPAVIGAVGAFAGTLGASAATAGAIGTIVGGAIVGAASGAVIQIGNNVIDGERSLSGIFKGVGTAMAVGAIGGALGGAGALLGKAAGSLFSSGLGKLVVDKGINMLGDIGGNIVGDLVSGNPITLEGVVKGAAVGIGAAGAMGRLGKLGNLNSSGKLGALGRGINKAGTKLEGIQTKASGVGESIGGKAGGKVKGVFAAPEISTIKPSVEVTAPRSVVSEAPTAPKSAVAESAPVPPKSTIEAPAPIKPVAESPTAKPTAEQPMVSKAAAEQPGPSRAQPEAAEPPKASPEAEGVPSKTAKDQEILDETAAKKNIDLTQEDLNTELDLVAKAKPKPIAEGDYDAEVDLGNGHKWKRQKETGAWCRHSPEPISCTLPEFGPKHPDMKVEMKPKAEIEAEVKAKTQAKAEAEAEVKPKPEAEAEVKTKSETEGEVKPETQPDAKPKELTGQEKAQERLQELGVEKTAKEMELSDLRKKRDALRKEYDEAMDAKNKAVKEWDAAKGNSAKAEAARTKALEALARAKATVKKINELPSDEALSKELKKLEGEIGIEGIKADPSSRGLLVCFSPDTLVLTPQGPRPIDELRAGDLVWTFDFGSHARRARPILQVHRGHTLAFHRLRTDRGEIVATSQHRFWVESDLAWRTADTLSPGEILRDADGGQLRVLENAREAVDAAATCTLSVEECHNFFVGPGALVHNEPVDVGLGGDFVIYRGTNPNPKFAGKIYIGQTTDLDIYGEARGSASRQGEHQKLAKKRLAEDAAGIKKLSVRDKAFYEFMKDATLEPIVKGIATQDQADYLEQRNIDLERQVSGKDNVMNRRNEITSESHMKAVVQRIKADPAVKAKGYCP